jgi:phosphatidylinositol alpha-1,6-mannosyltransferase
VVTVGRLDGRQNAIGYKGHDRIISQLGSLRRSGTPIKYLIAGIGDDRSRLEALVEREGVRDDVRFLGKVPHDRLPDLYRAADLFAMPSTGEAFGIVFLEAMACGTPAIGLAVGGAADALGHGELGRCVTESEFPQAFAAAVAQCRNRDLTLPDRVQTQFGYPVFVDRVQALVERLARPGAEG